MSNNEIQFDEMEQQIITDATAAFLGSLEAHAKRLGKKVDTDSILPSTKTREFFDNDFYFFANVLIDAHWVLEIEVDYDPFSEFERFPTVGDVLEYLALKLWDKRMGAEESSNEEERENN